MAFDIHAELVLSGPKNINTVLQDIRTKLKGFQVSVKIKPTNLQAVHDAIQRKLSNLSVDVKIKAGANLQSATNKIGSLNTAVAALVTNSNNANAALAQLSNTARSFGSVNANVARQVAGTTTATQGAAKATAHATDEFTRFGQQAGLAVRRFAAFTLATSAIFGFGLAIQKGVSKAIEFDKELTKLKQVTGFTAAGLKSLTGEIDRISTSFGVSSTELITVASTLKQAGLSATETKTALDALAKSSLAPSFDSMNETVEGSIAIMRQFGIGAGDLTKVLGSVNTVAAEFAVESRDIITAVQIAGGAFAAASKGVSQPLQAFQEFISVFTSVRQTTRESAESIATGLRTIFTRIQRGSTIEALSKLGIELKDTQGKFVGAYEAVQRLSEGLKRLDNRDPLFTKIGEELGGFRQINKVIPLIAQAAVSTKALSAAQRGELSLEKDAIIAQQALANQFAKTREQFLLLMRAVSDSSTFRLLVTVLNEGAKGAILFAKASTPLLPILAALGAIKAVPAIGKIGKGFISAGGLFQAHTQNQAITAPAGPKGIGFGGTSQSSAAAQASYSAINSNTAALRTLTSAILSGGGKTGVAPAVGFGNNTIGWSAQAGIGAGGGASTINGNTTPANKLTLRQRLSGSVQRGVGFAGRNRAALGAGAAGLVAAGSLAAPYVQDSYYNRSPRGAAIGGATSGAVAGGLAGAYAGSFFPGPGTAIGASIGATIGGIGGGVSAYKDQKLQDNFSDLENTAEALNKTLELFKDNLDETNDRTVNDSNAALSEYALSGEITGARDSREGGRLIASRGELTANSIADIVQSRAREGKGIADIQNNPEYLRNLGSKNTEVTERIAKISQEQSFAERIGFGDDTGNLIRKIQIQQILEKAGEQEIQTYTEIGEAEKKVIDSHLRFVAALELLSTKFDTIGSAALRVEGELTQFGAEQDNNLDTPLTGGRVIRKGNLENIFNNPKAYTNEQLNDAEGTVSRNNPDLKDLFKTFRQSADIQKRLPEILRDAYNKSFNDLAGNKGPEQEREEYTNTTTAELIKKQLEKEFGKGEFVNTLNSNITERFSAKGKIIQPNDIIPDIDKIIPDVGSLAQKTVQAAAKPFDLATDIYINSLNKMSQAQLKVADLLANIESTKAENRLSYLEATNNPISLSQKLEPFNAQVRSFGAGNNPAQIGNKISQLTQSILDKEKEIKELGPAAEADRTPEYQKLTQQETAFRTELGIANKALSLFTTNVRQAAIVAEIDKERARGDNTFDMLEEIATNNPRQNFELQRGAQEFIKFKQTGNLGKTDIQRKAVFDFAKKIAPQLDDKGQKKLTDDLREGIKKLLGPNDPNVLRAEAQLNAKDPGGKGLMDQLAGANKDQEDALGIIAKNMKEGADKWQTAIPNQLSLLLSKLDTLISDMNRPSSSDVSFDPADFNAAGGTIFKRRGTDTVPAMLTPGEFVVKQKEAQKHRGLLEQINAGGYASGGEVKETIEAGRAKRKAAYDEERQRRRDEFVPIEEKIRTAKTNIALDKDKWSKAARARRDAPYKKSGEIMLDGPGEGLTRAQYATGLTLASNERMKKADAARGIVNVPSINGRPIADIRAEKEAKVAAAKAQGPSINGVPIARKENKGPSINGVPIADFREGRKDKAEKEKYAEQVRTGTLPVTVAKGTINGVPIAELRKKRAEGRAIARNGNVGGIPISKAEGSQLAKAYGTGKAQTNISDKQKALQAELAAASKPKGNEFEAASNLQDARRSLKNLPGNIAANARQRKRAEDLTRTETDSIIRSSNSRALVRDTESLVKGANAGIAANGVGGIREGLAHQQGKVDSANERLKKTFADINDKNAKYASMNPEDKAYGKPIFDNVHANRQALVQGAKRGIASIAAGGLKRAVGLGFRATAFDKQVKRGIARGAAKRVRALANSTGFAEGGSVDNVPIYASEGEYVVSKKAMMANGGLVHAINRGKVRKYAAGGPVGASEFKDKAGGGGYSLALDSTAQATLTAFSKNFMAGVDKMAAAIEEFVSMDKKITFEGTVKDIVVKVQGETEFAQFVTTTIKSAVEELINARVSERMNPLTGEPRSV